MNSQTQTQTKTSGILRYKIGARTKTRFWKSIKIRSIMVCRTNKVEKISFFSTQLFKKGILTYMFLKPTVRKTSTNTTILSWINLCFQMETEKWRKRSNLFRWKNWWKNRTDSHQRLKTFIFINWIGLRSSFKSTEEDKVFFRCCS